MSEINLEGQRAVAPLVTHVRCKHCRSENTIIGPSSIAAYQYPGWRISFEEFYNPNGLHYCPEHSYKEWVLYCYDVDCETCMIMHNEDKKTFPYEWTQKQIYDHIKEIGWSCPEGNPFGGFQDLTGNQVYP